MTIPNPTTPDYIDRLARKVKGKQEPKIKETR